VADNQAIARTESVPQAGQQAPSPAEFGDFFTTHFRTLTVVVMAIGATADEAEEAAASAMEEVFRRWDQIATPLAYGKRAALSNFKKEKERGLDRIRERLAQGAEARRDGANDDGLNVWEDRQWVMQFLSSLPAAQREALALVVDGFTPAEIACLFGRTPEAVRQSLRGARSRLQAHLGRDRTAQTAGHSPSQPRKEAP
jgi:RNA polymerase sigma-70 factor (ECF subfamily)